MVKYIITGGEGFIGSHLVEKLANKLFQGSLDCIFTAFATLTLTGQVFEDEGLFT